MLIQLKVSVMPHLMWPQLNPTIWWCENTGGYSNSSNTRQIGSLCVPANYYTWCILWLPHLPQHEAALISAIFICVYAGVQLVGNSWILVKTINKKWALNSKNSWYQKFFIHRSFCGFYEIRMRGWETKSVTFLWVRSLNPTEERSTISACQALFSTI